MNTARQTIAALSALCLAFSPVQMAFAADYDASGLRLGDGGGYSSGGGESYARQLNGRSVNLGVGKSIVIDLPRDASEVLVANPAVANAVVRSSRKAYLIGMEVGETNVIFFDAQGNQLLALDVSVGRDMGALLRSLQNAIPKGNITVKPLGDSVVLSGTATSSADAQVAVDLATRIVGDAARVVNAITIEGKEQVLLKVSVVEMQRNVTKQLGVDFSKQWNVAGTTLAIATRNVFAGATGPGIGASPGGSIGGGTIPFADGTLNPEVTIRALEENGVLRTLAEPNLTAVSGETAKFLAGGEVGYRTLQGTGATSTYITQFKPYGVSLEFTPVVLSEGKISLSVATEVSEIAGYTDGVPATTVRRANSTVEIPSGGSLVMGGLLQQRNSQTINGVPYLKNLPVLGQLFRSQQFQRNETELVIIVTPYLAKPTAPDKIARPDDGFANANDAEQIFLGRINKIYTSPSATGSISRRAGGAPNPNGGYGFIID
jgi:pilus assembly protein CpaC